MSDFSATNKKCIVFGAISACLPILLLIFWNDIFRYFYYRRELDMHIALLQTIASVVLIIGIIKNNYRLLVPWMITASIFGYDMLYLSLNIWGRLFDSYPEPQIRFIIIYGILAFLIWAAKIFYTRVVEMRKIDNVAIVPISMPLNIKTVD